MLLNIILIICFIIIAINVIGWLYNRAIDRKYNKRFKPSQNAPKTESIYHWVIDTQNAERFVKAYKQDFDENEDYHLSAKELKEDYEGEKVYKYEPYELPLKMEGLDVYSYIDEGEWLKVGRLKKNADIDGKLILRLFPNTYKYVTEDSIEKETDESYFGIEVIKNTI